MEFLEQQGEWKDNYSLFTLFSTKDIKIFRAKEEITITVPTIEELLQNDDIAFLVSFFRKQNFDTLKERFFLWKIENSYDLLKILLFEAGQYQEFYYLKNRILNSFNFLFKDQLQIIESKIIFINNVFLDKTLWEYILYVIYLTQGEKIKKPIVYKTQQEEEFFKQMEEAEKRIAKIKKNSKDQGSWSEDILKVFITINYIFPSLTMEYLFKQTMVQISWLHQYATKAVNYDVEKNLFVNGKTKKKKLKFFFDK